MMNKATDLPLHAAVRSKDLTTLKHLLDDPKVDKNAEDSLGVTALIEACILGIEEAVKILLSKEEIKAQPDSPFRHTPLRGATVTGQYHIIPILLEHGADPNALSEGNRTPLMGACFLRKEVIGDHAEISEKCVMALLQDIRTDPTLRNSFNESALDLAKMRGYDQSILLVQQALDRWQV